LKQNVCQKVHTSTNFMATAGNFHFLKFLVIIIIGHYCPRYFSLFAYSGFLFYPFKMIFHKHIKVILLLAALVVPPQLADAKDNKSIELTAFNKVSWTKLTFTGSKFFTSINVNIQLGPENPFSPASAIKTGTVPVKYSDEENKSRLLTLKWSLNGMLAQGQYEVKVWFKTTDGLPYKRMRFRNDDDPWVKSYYWEDTGVRRHKIKPGASAENTQPSAKWTDRKEHFYAFPGESAGCSSISDPSLIFYLLSTLDPETLQAPKEICVFGKKQVHRLTIQQVKSSPIEVSFKARTSSQKEETIKNQITPLVYSIKTAPMAPEKEEPENFSLLGLHKNILIYMDPEKQLPVRISGSNNSIGKIDLELRNAELN
jgi:hypothetical protein